MKTCSVEGCDRKHLAKGLCDMHYQRKRASGTLNARGKARDGEGWVGNHGYHMRQVDGKKILTHVAVAEAALGKPLPKGAVVHHIDGDKLNNTPDNLLICPSHAYHQLIHRRQRTLDACGHADWDRCRYCKQYDAPENLKTIPRAGRTSGVVAYHLACAREKDRYRWPAKAARAKERKANATTL